MKAVFFLFFLTKKLFKSRASLYYLPLLTPNKNNIEKFMSRLLNSLTAMLLVTLSLSIISEAKAQTESNPAPAADSTLLQQDDLTARQARFLLDEKPLSAMSLFGEQIDPLTQTGTFSLLELAIPGNSSLPVRVKHQAKLVNHDVFGLGYFDQHNAVIFGIPRIYGIKSL